MGTNYYLNRPRDTECPECGARGGRERLHIGKSSAGWCFILHVVPEEGINDLDDWKRLFEDPASTITNEYGDAVDADEMVRQIANRRARREWPDEPDEEERLFHEQNQSERGPHGLARGRIGIYNVVGHGAGTWYLKRGEFS